jgi:hypothetical protein
MSYDVFISYRRDSSASQARLIRSELTNRNYKVFLDVADLDRGYFDETLLTTIAETPSFLLMLAPGSLDQCVNENDWLRRELGQAIATKRTIIPIYLAGFSFPPSLPSDIAELPRHQAVEYSHTLFDATIEKIIKAIGAPRARPHRLRLPLAIAAAVLIAVAAAAYLGRGHFTEPPRSAKFTATVVPLLGSDQAQITRSDGPPSQTGDAPAQADVVPGAPDPSLYTLDYRSRRTPDGYAVDYRLPYLDLLRSGGPIVGIRYETSPFLFTFPQVRATIANNAARQIVVTSVVLDIKTSELNREVVLTIDDGSTNTLVLVNHGWADVEDARLVFTIAGGGRDGAKPVVSAPQELSLGTFAASKVVPIVKYVPRELADADTANVDGEIEYGPAGQRRTVKIATTVKLRTRPGKPLPPSDAYDLFFKSGETGRIVADLPVAHQIKPGEAEALDLRISTDRSSTTSMSLSFLTAEGEEIPANGLTLDLFVPRFLGMQLRQRVNRSKN